MTEPYPVGEERPLDGTNRRRLLGMSIGGKARSSQELPTTTAHEVLVYRVGGRFRLADGLGLAHEDVVNATHVSSVDMTHDRQVVVELPIPSRDSQMFHVLVTFTCTVTEPLVVVEKGVSARDGLLSYLKSHHEIVHLGLRYPLTEINEVRIDVEAEVTSLAAIRPPALPGMFVALASVEVASPAELTEFHQKVLGLQQTHTLDSMEQGYLQNLHQERQGYENEKAAVQQQHEQALDAERTKYENAKTAAQQQQEHLLAIAGQRQGHVLDSERRQHANEAAFEQQRHDQLLDQGRRQYDNAAAYTQQEHAELLQAAGQRHQLSLDHERTKYENAKAITQQEQDQVLAMGSLRHELSARQATSEFARQELEKARELLGTNPLAALEYAMHAGRIDEREYAAGMQADADRQHADERRREDQAHEERMRELQWDREVKLRAERKAEEDQQFVRAIKLELLRDLGKRGYLETIDPETLATELLGELTAGSRPGPASAQLPPADAAPATPVAPAASTDGPTVREEDGD